MKQILIFIIAIFLNFNCFSQTYRFDEINDYIHKNSINPSDYVISKFKDYDYVFLGECHRVKHDVDFVASLIPKLYENGITNLGYEMSDYTNQHTVDSLLSAKEWNENLINQTVSRGAAVIWGYSEYLNIFEEIWKLNKSLAPNQPKFRIILIGPEFNPCGKGLDKFGGIYPDSSMAFTLEREVISHNQKALIYCGMHHAFTSYKQPIYDFEKNEFNGFVERFGNIIYNKYPNKTFTIFMHAPWGSNKGYNKPSVKPASGVIDSIMNSLNNTPCGFDVKNTPVGTIKSDNTLYAFGYSDFSLKDYCDGYIFLNPFEKYKNVSVSENYYKGDGFEKMKEFLKCMGWTEEELSQLTVEKVIELVAEEANIERKYEHLK